MSDSADPGPVSATAPTPGAQAAGFVGEPLVVAEAPEATPPAAEVATVTAAPPADAAPLPEEPPKATEQAPAFPSAIADQIEAAISGFSAQVIDMGIVGRFKAWIHEALSEIQDLIVVTCDDDNNRPEDVQRGHLVADVQVGDQSYKATIGEAPKA